VVKLFYEAIETIDPGPSEAIKAVGGNGMNNIMFAVMPQILPYFISYALYAFEINVRASTILGYIGAGGIGLQLKNTLDMFSYNQTGMIILVVFLVVLVIDFVSTKAREALMR
jgi:phosphonate transport system permease protein